MGLPIWQTKAGDLGTISENVYYSLSLKATDTDHQPVSYSLIAGDMPEGLVLQSGLIFGTPKIAGTPQAVPESVTDSFTIRATTTTGDVSDRTFTLTVAGERTPVILTPGGSLGTYLDATYLRIQLVAIDEDLSDVLTWAMTSGSLPPGVTLSPSGLLSGYILPVSALPPEAVPGYDSTPYSQYAFDFNLLSSATTYNFTVSVFGGKEYDVETYTIHIEPNPVRIPYVVTPVDAIGTVLHDNYFAYQFVGFDFDNEPLTYELVPVTGYFLPPGLTLDPTTGWLYGTIPPQAAVESTYKFGIRVFKTANQAVVSSTVEYTMVITGDTATAIHWITPSDLSIENGEISDLEIRATAWDDRTLYYSIISGSLPDGLLMLSDGLIIGRPTFGGFTLDNGATTDGSETSFDSSFKFTVQVIDDFGEISVTKSFTLRVDKTNVIPYEMLYLVAKPPTEQKQAYKNIINDINIIPESSVYRGTDPYYGRSQDIRMLLLNGTNPSTASDYIAAMDINHQTRILRFGEFKKARALDSDGSIKYEVIYVEIIDRRNNLLGESVSKSLALYGTDGQAIVDRGFPDTRDAAGNYVIYPGSLTNMRLQILDSIGQANPNTLPLWMTSKQEDGRILGLINAAVLCYVQPGEGGQILFNLNRSGYDISSMSFEVDRYVWDTNMSVNFDKVTGEFIPGITQGFQAPDENDKYLKFPKIGVYN